MSAPEGLSSEETQSPLLRTKDHMREISLYHEKPIPSVLIKTGDLMVVEVGPLYNEKQAIAAADKWLKENLGWEWTGQWWTTEWRKMSVIEVRHLYSLHGDLKVVKVGPIYNQREAVEHASKWCSAHPAYEWTGQWWTTEPGRMSVIVVQLKVTERAILLADNTNKEEIATRLSQIYASARESVETFVAEGPDYKVLYVTASAGKDEGIILQVSADAEATIFKIVNNQDGIRKVDANVIHAKAQVWSGAGAGVSISASLFNAQVSAFDVNLGVGVSSEAGIKDDSLTIKLFGCGFKIGRKIEISVLDTAFGVDFGRCSIM